MTTRDELWPPLSYTDWKDTQSTLHMWTQIVGKIRHTLMPWWNHAWHVPLYVTTSGLTTSSIPHGDEQFSMTFDFQRHELHIRTSGGKTRKIPLRAISVAAFYADVMRTLDEMGLAVQIHGAPNEVEPAIPFQDDTEHASYDRDAVRRFWRVLLQTDRVFKQFQTAFLGKCSPVHFFWGSFDLAVTRFSGRHAPLHPGGLPNMPLQVAQEAYTHEVSSAGFWPGGESLPEPVYYSYAYPTPEGFADAAVSPDAARFEPAMGEFILPYDAVRTAADPGADLTSFLRSTYEAAADLADWDRAALECEPGRPGVPRAVPAL